MASAAKADVQRAFSALANSSIYNYDAFKWDIPPTPLIGGIGTATGPTVPVRPPDPAKPDLVKLDVNVPNPSFGATPTNRAVAPGHPVARGAERRAAGQHRQRAVSHHTEL
jgi:hypothetical protein